MSFKFICPRCGNPGEVPFQPSNPDRVLCSDCHEETGGKTYDLSKTDNAPRKKHNTRVVINFICAECGEPSSLDYAPKGVPIEKMKCSQCLVAEKGSESRWSVVRELKTREEGLAPRRTFKINCPACGNETELPFKPDPEKTYFCPSCYQNDGIPVGPNHREGVKEQVEPNLFKRTRRRKISSNQEDG